MQWSKANKFKRFTAILTASALFSTGIYFTPAGQQAEQTNLALNKTVYYSSEESLSTSGTDTHAVKAVDGDKTTSIFTYKVTKGKKYIKVDPYGKITCKIKPGKKVKKAAVKITCGKKSVTVNVTI